jgi:multimeric flavodoxin WrbA
MAEQPLVILASARKHGDTRSFLNRIFADKNYELVDLLDFQISSYDYSNNYSDTDEFEIIIDKILRHKIIIFATPVYWYAMSGLMKIFFDRFTDIVTSKKHLGRQLKGKATFLIAVGVDEELPDGFLIPFKLTSAYLDMEYHDSIYYSTKFPKTEDQFQEIILAFKNKLKSTNR